MFKSASNNFSVVVHFSCVLLNLNSLLSHVCLCLLVRLSLCDCVSVFLCVCVLVRLCACVWACVCAQTRNRFESTRSEVESLMRKMKENPHEHKSNSQHIMEGYLFIQEKRTHPHSHTHHGYLWDFYFEKKIVNDIHMHAYTFICTHTHTHTHTVRTFIFTFYQVQMYYFLYILVSSFVSSFAFFHSFRDPLPSLPLFLVSNALLSITPPCPASSSQVPLCPPGSSTTARTRESPRG